MPRYLIKVHSLQSVFRWTNSNEKEMQVQLARICVLYEDFMLEYAGATESEIKALDRTDALSRQFYFVRRSLGTVAEMESAIHKLNKNSEFKNLKRGLPAKELKVWNDAVAFFTNKHEFLKEWRDDLGGHFLDRAAEFALREMHPTTVGSIELYETGGSHNVKMKFAYDLIAVAMTRQRGESQPVIEFLEQGFKFLTQAWGHVAQVVHTLVQNHLWQRFR